MCQVHRKVHEAADPRPQRSRLALESAFLSLLKRMPMEKITVKALVERAGVNRSTFYHYYSDISEFIDDVEEGIWQTVYVVGSIETEARRLELQRIYAQRDMFRLFAGRHGDRLFMDRLRQAITDNWEDMGLFPQLTIPRPYAIAGIAGIFTEVLGAWIRNGFVESPREMGDILAVLIDGFPERLFSNRGGE